MLPRAAANFWHDEIRAFLGTQDPGAIQPPPAIRQVAHLVRLGHLPSDVPLTILESGLQVDPMAQGKTVRWLSDRFPASGHLLADESACSTFRVELLVLDGLAEPLRDELAAGVKDRRARADARREATEAFRSVDEGAREAFREALRAISSNPAALDEVVAHCRRTVCGLAEEALDGARLKRPYHGRWQRGQRRARLRRKLEALFEEGGAL